MDHPLRSDSNKSLRKRVVGLLENGFSIARQSNIIFVCGGNAPESMRRRFQAEFPTILPGFEFFEPEFAMKSYFTLGDQIPFDISEFEELVGQLSHSIVLFPEAPGSIAETGYFSAIPELAQKIVLAVDGTRQRSDSFISLGPAKKIHDASRFQPNIQFDYDNPDFTVISNRIIERAPLHRTKQHFEVKAFAEATTFELFALIQQLVSLLVIATIEDIEFFLRSLYDSQISSSKVKKVVSILVGSKRLVEVGDYGHLTVPEGVEPFLQLRDGFKTTNVSITIDISALFFSAEPELKALFEGLSDAD